MLIARNLLILNKYNYGPSYLKYLICPCIYTDAEDQVLSQTLVFLNPLLSWTQIVFLGWCCAVIYSWLFQTPITRTPSSYFVIFDFPCMFKIVGIYCDPMPVGYFFFFFVIWHVAVMSVAHHRLLIRRFWLENFLCL